MAGVRYRGLDPRTRPVRWAVFLVAAGVTLSLYGGTAAQAVADWLTGEQDRLAWYAVRLLGILSWAALTGSVLYGLLLSTGILDAIAHRTVSFALHQELAAIGLGLALVHAALLTLDSSVPFTLTELLIPFAAPYRPVWVGLGQLGLYLTAVIVVSFSIRRRIGQRTWRRLHYVTFLIALATTLHGLMAGSDPGAPFAWPMYGGATLALLALTAYRVARAVRDRGIAPTVTRPSASES
jgi:DMSO/TMAO reductase YedYZ heme-binding membrane subunit